MAERKPGQCKDTIVIRDDEAVVDVSGWEMSDWDYELENTTEITSWGTLHVRMSDIVTLPTGEQLSGEDLVNVRIEVEILRELITELCKQDQTAEIEKRIDKIRLLKKLSGEL